MIDPAEFTGLPGYGFAVEDTAHGGVVLSVGFARAVFASGSRVFLKAGTKAEVRGIVLFVRFLVVGIPCRP